jgi:hypothetical protein
LKNTKCQTKQSCFHNRTPVLMKFCRQIGEEKGWKIAYIIFAILLIANSVCLFVYQLFINGDEVHGHVSHVDACNRVQLAYCIAGTSYLRTVLAKPVP